MARILLKFINGAIARRACIIGLSQRLGRP